MSSDRAGLEALEPRTHLAAVLWDGGGDGTSWEDPLNWSGDVLPTGADDVTLDVPGLVTVSHTSGATETVNSLVCLERLVLQGGRLDVATSWQQPGPLELSGGTIGGAGELWISGDAHWSSGTMVGTGTTRVVAQGSLAIEASVTLSRRLINNFAMSWTAGSITLDGGVIENPTFGTFTISSSGGIVGAGAGGQVYNGGTINSTSIGATIGVPLWRIHPASRLHVLSGRVTLSGEQRNLGAIQIDAGATVEVTGTAKLTSAVSGAGTFHVSGGGTTVSFGLFQNLGTLRITAGVVNFEWPAGSSVVNHLELSGGLLTGANGLTLTGASTWTGGAMVGTSHTTVALGATLDISGTVVLGRELIISGAVTSTGTVYWTAHNIVLSGGVLFNEIGGTMVVSTGGSVLGASNGVFRNGGQVNVLSPTLLIDAPVFFTRYSAAIRAMTLTLSGGVLNGGNIEIEQELRLSGTTKFIANTYVHGNGGVTILGGSHTFSGVVWLGSRFRIESGTAFLQQGATVGSLDLRGGYLAAGLEVRVGAGGVSWNYAIVGPQTVIRASTPILNAGSDFASLVLYGSLICPGSIIYAGSITLRGGLLRAEGDIGYQSGSAPSGGLVVYDGRVECGVLRPGGARLVGSATLDCDIDLHGTMYIDGGATLHLTGRQFTVAPEGALYAYYGLPSAGIDGTGTVLVLGALRVQGTALDIGAGVALDMRGWAWLSGNLAVHGAFAQVSGGALTGGTWDVSAALIVGAPITRNQTTLTIGYFGQFLGSLSGLNTNVGTLRVMTYTTVHLAPLGGLFTNLGELRLSRYTQLVVDGSFTQTSTGRIVSETSGPPPLIGRLSVSGAVSLAGTIHVSTVGGNQQFYQPGAPIDLITAGSISGQFSLVSFQGLEGVPAGTLPVIQYAPQTVRLNFLPPGP